MRTSQNKKKADKSSKDFAKKADKIFAEVRRLNERLDASRNFDPQKLHEPFTI